MPQVQTNSNKILEELGLFLKKKEHPNDFVRQKFIREIDKLPDELERVHARAVLEGVCGNENQSIEMFEQALLLPEGWNVCQNYWVLLKSFGVKAETLQKGYQLANICSSFVLQNELLLYAVINLDIKSFERVFDVLVKAKKLGDGENVADAQKEVEIMKRFIERFNVNEQQLKQIGDIALQVMSDHKIKANGNHVEHGKQRSYLSISYVLDADSVTPDALFDINYDFVERLVDNELDELPVVAQFHREHSLNSTTHEPEGAANVS